MLQNSLNIAGYIKNIIVLPFFVESAKDDEDFFFFYSEFLTGFSQRKKARQEEGRKIKEAELREQKRLVKKKVRNLSRSICYNRSLICYIFFGK